MDNLQTDVFVQGVLDSVKGSLTSVEDLMTKGVEVVANPLYINVDEATEAIVNEIVKVYKIKKTEAKKLVKVKVMEEN